MDSTLQIVERAVGDVTVLALTGQVTLDDGDLLVGRRIRELVDRGRVKIILDLAGVTHIDSSGVGMMAGRLKTVCESGGDLKLLNLTTRTQRILGTMKLLLVFETFDSEELAIRSFAASVR